MIDPFVLLTPILLFGVIALVGFVGCAGIIGIDEWDPQEGPPQGPGGPPSGFHSTAGDGIVTLFWVPFPDALLFEIDRQISPPGIPPASYDSLDSVTPSQLVQTPDGFVAYEDKTVTNGITYHYVVRTVTGNGTSPNSPDIEATPTTPFGPFVTDFVAGTLRPGEDSWFGFAFVATVPGIEVQKMGRFYLPANSGTHDMILIDAASSQILGKATVDLASEDLDGFKYAPVIPPVPLNMNDEYYILSLESLGGDDFLTQDTTVITNAEASVTNAIDSSPSLVAFTPAGGPNHVYGPLNFQY